MGNGGKWKAKSKRTTTKMRVKVEKKVRDHHKKLKKEMKKNPGKFKKSKKDPGVPGNCPFKDKVSFIDYFLIMWSVLRIQIFPPINA